MLSGWGDGVSGLGRSLMELPSSRGWRLAVHPVSTVVELRLAEKLLAGVCTGPTSLAFSRITPTESAAESCAPASVALPHPPGSASPRLAGSVDSMPPVQMDEWLNEWMNE